MTNADKYYDELLELGLCCDERAICMFIKSAVKPLALAVGSVNLLDLKTARYMRGLEEKHPKQKQKR